MRAALGAMFCVLIVTACTMGPDYRRPAIDAPDAFRFASRETAETANVEWWKPNAE